MIFTHLRTVALSIFFFILGTVSIGFVYAWSGPPHEGVCSDPPCPPGGNVAAPINVGTTNQVKDGGLSLNTLAVFGNSLFGGAAGSNAYLNFGDTSGVNGYGIRDKDGTLEFKNDGGTWGSLQTIICALVNCTATHVSFLVDKNGLDQSVSPATWTKLTWSNEEFDTNSNFVNNRFTPTVLGKYIFELTVGCNTTTSICEAGIYKNGVIVADSWGGAAGGNYASGHVSIILDMNGTTDYVETYVNGGNSTAIFGNTAYTNFSGALLSP